MRVWILLLPLLTGCAPAVASPSAAAPASVVGQFSDALRQRDGAAACALLSARTREDVGPSCAEQVLTLALTLRTGPPGATEVWGDAARVRAGDTVFLSAYDQGWRITGAGCERRGQDLPYRCALGGS
jgi:hypothetical protein